LNYQDNYVELVVRMSKFLVALLIIFKIPTKLFRWSDKIILMVQQNYLYYWEREDVCFYHFSNWGVLKHESFESFILLFSL